MIARSIPANFEQVTDAWLTAVLRGDGAISQASVTAHSTELVEPQGAAAVVARFVLEYDIAETGAPRSIVAKLPSPYEPIRALMQGMGGYVGEVEFYRQLGNDPGIPTPHCFHADIDPSTAAFVLLLEDMSESRVADFATPSVEDVELAVRHLAPFHARWWNHDRLRTLAFLRYPGSPANETFLRQGLGAFSAALPAAKEQFGAEFPAGLAATSERLLANLDAVVEMRQQDDGSTTLVHGDYHPQQIFYESERGGRFAVFDWQTVSAGSGGDDLARIIVTGLSKEQRSACDWRLLELYRSLLVEHGVTGYDMKRCWEDFRQGLLTTLVINVIAAPNIDPAFIEAEEAASEVSAAEAFFVRLAAAIDAHDASAALPT